jgi:2-polyprenyl-3-methyl-5-hydroxy-6-metoxy-1,4-benzoquinol methylase
MANERGKEIDNTHLSIEQAEARGFIHRDYIAHCLRWTHVAKYLHLQGRYKTARVIDIGCGKDMPLARMLMTSRLAPEKYLGIEYNKMNIPDMFKNTKFKPDLISGIDFTKIVPGEVPGGLQYGYSTCFEVLEHVEPIKAIEILQHLPKFLSENSVSWFSTPCWDEKVGAAANHVNEMTYEAFGSLLEEMGYKILMHWGTFASIKDYKNKLLTNFDWNVMFTKLREYYDSNYLATVFAPMFPEHSRNVLWETQYVGKLKIEERKFKPINKLEGRLGSSEKWRDLVKCLECARNYVRT